MYIRSLDNKGNSILWAIGVNSCVAWFPAHQRGLASGIIGGGLTFGIGIGGWVATMLIQIAGSWQGAFRTWGIILAVSAAIYAVLMREPGKDRACLQCVSLFMNW